MLNLPQKTLTKIKSLLLRRQKEVDDQLKALENDDPIIMAAEMVEASESGTDSWMAEVHGRITSVKNDLVDLSSKIRISLLQIKKGTYGKCERCGNPIEAERLEAMPTASLCISCSNKKTKK